jgi:hypothetical protein
MNHFTPAALFAACATLAVTASASAATFDFSTGGTTNAMAMASRPSSAGVFEIETADDFVLTDTTSISSANFTGLLQGTGVQSITVEIYRVFPLDSDTVRSPSVPTRVNSPSDVAFDSRDSAASGLSFSTTLLAPSFTALNSVAPGGIHPSPNTTTGGNGPVTGQEVLFNVTFASGLLLGPGHYFFVPQVGLADGTFYWLSSARPIVAPGTPFSPDLQAWTRDEFLSPDWVRVGTDIVGGAAPPTFNASFALSGVTVPAVPEPSSTALMVAGLIALGWSRARRGGGAASA